MPEIISGNAIVADEWQLLREVEGELPAGKVIVPLGYWLEHQPALSERSDTGVWLGADQPPAQLGNAIATLPLIAIDFPSHMDGRGFSYARELRQRHGYSGEIRAIGGFMRDQLLQLKRCGFDAYALENTNLHDALASFDDFSDAYQADVLEPTPLFRRR